MCVQVGVRKLSMLPTQLVFKPQQVLHILWPKKLTKYLYVQSSENLSSFVSWLKKSIEMKPYVKTGHMSNQRKDEFVNDSFCIQSFWGGHDNFSPKTWIVPKVQSAQILWFSKPVEFLIAVTRKSLTSWSRITDHRKAERVAYQFGIQDF
jgi:hypothetical protein